MARSTLFCLRNSPAQIVELSVEGEVLQIIRVSGAQDTEGIARIGQALHALGGATTLYAVDIRAGRPRESRPAVGYGCRLNTLLQQPGGGDRVVGQIRAAPAVGQERWPLRTEPAGQPRWSQPAPAGLGALLFINDLASVTTHAPTGNLLLGRESAMVVEYDLGRTGEPAAAVARPARAGTQDPQPRGLALAPDGVFIVSSPTCSTASRSPRSRDGTLAGGVENDPCFPRALQRAGPPPVRLGASCPAATLALLLSQGTDCTGGVPGGRRNPAPARLSAWSRFYIVKAACSSASAGTCHQRRGPG